MNGSARAIGPFRLDDGTDATRNLPPMDYEEPDGYSSPPRWESQPGAVGASALPSLSPQTSDLLPAPHADPMVNHTLVVSDAGQLAAYDDLPAVRNDRAFDGTRYRRRPSGPPREPWVQRYLFSHRLIYVSAGLAVVLVIALAGWWFSSGRYQQVPAVSGLSWHAARTVLKNEGLETRLGKPAHNALPKGDVIRTLPARGSRVAGGSSVTLIVSLGPVMRVVPNVSGQPEAAAKAYLVQHHLKVGQDKPAVSSSVPAGDVIGTIPGAYAQRPAEPAGQAGRQRGTRAAQLRRHAGVGRAGGSRRGRLHDQRRRERQGQRRRQHDHQPVTVAEHPDHPRRGGHGPLLARAADGARS